jgi:predicted transcriptional regulator
MIKAGAPPKFQEAHVNWVFWKISSKQPFGRKALVEETGLGEGSIRTILAKLDEYGLINSSRSGRSLTPDGEKVKERLNRIIKIADIGSLSITKSPYNVAVRVKGGAEKVNTGMEQRNAAIRAGAKGTTTITIKGGSVIIPGFGPDVNVREEYPEDAERLIEILEADDGDAIIIGSEIMRHKADEAAWLGASTLLF